MRGAFACAHAGGIVHRDIKPENLFLTQQAANIQVVKVLDFGISKSAMSAVESHGRKTAKTTLPMGTPGYMSPEQIRACGAVDARTDIWALGCVLSELITGSSAFDAPTEVQLGVVILEREAVPLRQVMPEAPAELEAVILRCLEKDPDHRFQDVAELAAALYPFGPRRARLSDAERCHQELQGQHRVVIAFNSVPPPTFGDGHTPLPVSSTSAFTSATPVSASPPARAPKRARPPPLSVLEYPAAQVHAGPLVRPGSRWRWRRRAAWRSRCARMPGSPRRRSAQPFSPVVDLFPAPAVATVAPAERAAAATIELPGPRKRLLTDTDTAKAAKGGESARRPRPAPRAAGGARCSRSRARDAGPAHRCRQ